MTVNHRRLKEIVFNLAGTDYQVQLHDWKLNNDTADPKIFHTYGGDAEDFAEDEDPKYSLDLKFYADWRSAGISDFLTVHDGETVAFTLTHHPGIVGESHQYVGSVQIKAPSVGGAVRTTELTETQLQCVGKPVYVRL